MHACVLFYIHAFPSIKFLAPLPGIGAFINIDSKSFGSTLDIVSVTPRNIP